MNSAIDACLRLRNIEHAYAASGWRLFVENFFLQPGELVCLIGPNGAGKSTLLKIAAGILAPGSGRVELCGSALSGMQRRQVAQTLGYLPQEVQSDFDYSVEEVVRLGRYPHLRGIGSLGAADFAVVDECMRRVDVLRFRDRPLSRLSGGERKRVFLASVLAQEPRVLLLDEPTGSLDMQHQVSFFRLLRELAGEGMGMAVVVHEINLASLYADRLLLMRDGHIHVSGSADEVVTKDNILAVYGDGLFVQRHPGCARPVVLPDVAGIAGEEGVHA